jgi:hypothetical protein
MVGSKNSVYSVVLSTVRPPGHVWQAEAPAAESNIPIEHTVHSLLPALEYEPAAHTVTWLAEHLEPAGHSTHWNTLVRK